MARWIYAALALGWVLSMIYECVQTGTGIALYFFLGVIGLTASVILFVRDLTRGGEQNVPRMVYFLGAAISAALFYRALSKAAYAGTYVQFMPSYLVMFAYFLGTGLYLWWKALREKR